MTQLTFNYLWIAATVLMAGGAASLFYMMWAASRSTGSRFTRSFLRILSVWWLVAAFEISTAAYRTLRIGSGCIPLDANAIGIIGRIGELIMLVVLVRFLLRAEVRKALNGDTPPNKQDER